MTEPLRIAICEDTELDCKKLTDILDKSEILNSYTVFKSGEELLSSYRVDEYDLIITDIYMKELSGVDVASKIREIDKDTPIAFITTSTDFTLEGYRLTVFRYIEKPYEEEAITEMLYSAKIKKDSKPALHLYKNRKEIKIPFNYILFFEQQTRSLLIHLKNGEIVEINEKLSNYSDVLNQQNFFDAHKSFSVNLAYVRYINNEFKCFVMMNGENVPIRRENFNKAKIALEDYLFSKTRGIRG